jgi:hypothetical protein
MYESASLDYTSVIGTSAMDSARRAQLIARANDQDDAAIDALVASTDDLKAQRKELVAERTRQRNVLQSVASRRRALDAQLASLLEAARRDVGSAARLSAARERAVVRVAAAADIAPPTRPPGPITPRPTHQPPSGGVSPHHNDPFLACTRARESGGNYGIVSSSGYFGAYQFLASTWDTTAAHAGRMDIVGVLPSRASASDQDEMAWVLYQWQGKSPWGGRC